MITIQASVRTILLESEEALFALTSGFMNLSAYAKQIRPQVEALAKKPVGLASIVVTLSRLEKQLTASDSLIQDIVIDNITSKSPLSEIVFGKTPTLLAQVSSLYKKLQTKGDDFFTLTVSTSEVTIICSDRLKAGVLAHLTEKPLLIETNLAAIGLSLHPKYYHLPNVTFSLLRKIAQKRIVLAETITTHTEIIFVFKTPDLPQMLALFTAR